MEVPVQIIFRGFPHSDAIEFVIREKVAKLERFSGRITSCRVILDLPHNHQHKGKIYKLTLDIRIPGREIVVGRNPDDSRGHENIYVAIRDAFDAARKQLQQYGRRAFRHAKQHVEPPRGRVVRIFGGGEDYGFLQTPDGREVYFHKNSVLNDEFDRLSIGAEVRFSEELGENGPQASTVELLRAAA